MIAMSQGPHRWLYSDCGASVKTNSFATQRAFFEASRTPRGKEARRYPPAAFLLTTHVAGRACLCFAAQIVQKTSALQKTTAATFIAPPSRPLELISIDILGSLTRTKQGKRFMIIMADQYIKLTRAIPVTRITVSQVAKVVLADWIMQFHMAHPK